MGSATPLLDILSAHLPAAVSAAELSALSSSQSQSIVETLLSFALGGECPTRLASARKEWLRTQPSALKALQDHLASKGAKRARDSADTDDAAPKRQKTASGPDADAHDPPLFTLPNISTTSPVRKKVDVTVHTSSIRFVHPTTRALEASIPLASITRTFLLPTRGKSKGHWTVVLLPTDVPDKTKTSPPSAQQIIFGLDALSTAAFETTSYSSGASTPNSTTQAHTTSTTIAKGEETAASVRKFLAHIPVPLYEPSATVFRSACATPKSRDGAAGIDAYLGAKQGTLWFFDTGIFWGESKPCEFWSVEDLTAKDGVRLISATGRTCSVILSRKPCSSVKGREGDEDEEEQIETEFSMVDGREQDPINAWARNRKHLFGKSSAQPCVSVTAAASPSKHNNKEAGPSSLPPNGTIKGAQWDDSDPDDDDFEVASSENLELSTTNSDESDSGGAASGDESEGVEDSGEEASEAEEEELREADHPLLRPGAMPRMSKAVLDMAVDMFRDDFDALSEEEDELEE